jgi:GT2 family glycosyltransferase
LLWRDGSTFLLSNAASDDGLRRPVDYTGTASLLVRSAVWDAIGGLDEQFYPAYHIDVNLAMSVRAAGFYVSIEPGSVVRHHSGESSSKIARSFYGETNRKLFVEKWKQSLERYDSRPDPMTPEAIERALRRALLFSEQCRLRPLPLVSPRPALFDRERQMLAHTIRRARLQESFADHLSRLIEANEAARHIFEAEAGAAIRSFHTFAADTAARLDVLERKASLTAAPLRLGRRILRGLRRS